MAKEKAKFSVQYQDGYYIEINSTPNPFSKGYEFNSKGESTITVYKSIERSGTHTDVEHVLRVGSFNLSGLETKTAADLLTEIRKGIEDIIRKNR